MFRFSLILIVPVALIVWYYNYWAIGCGRCTSADFWRIGPNTLLWAAVILAAFSLLLFLRWRADRFCKCRKCGSNLHPAWSYCPECGARGR